MIKKRGWDTTLLREIITKLSMGEPLPDKFRDHALVGNFIGHRECHITPDFLLLYRLDKQVLTLTAVRTGSHSDLFGK